MSVSIEQKGNDIYSVSTELLIELHKLFGKLKDINWKEELDETVFQPKLQRKDNEHET